MAPYLPVDRLLFPTYLELEQLTSSVSAMEEVYDALNWIHANSGLQPLVGDAIVKSLVEGVQRMYAIKKELINFLDCDCGEYKRD